MSNTISWSYDPTVTITSFALQKSTDKGVTFAALATVAYDPSGANFSVATRKFFYVDAAGAAGDVYRVTSTGAFGVSGPAVAVAPPSEPDKCTIIGYALDGLGRARTDMAVTVTVYGTSGERWVKNPVGTVAHNPQALGMTFTQETVFTTDQGIWQVDLVQRALVRITIEELGYEKSFEVPGKTGPVNIRDVADYRGASHGGLYAPAANLVQS